MDETDIQLCRLLFMNARQPYRAISKALGISNQAVHRRVQLLEEQGVIRRYTVTLSDDFANAVRVRIGGPSTLTSFEELVDALKKDERTLRLVYCSTDMVSVTALLKRLEDLDDYLGFLKREVGMSTPKVAFTGPGQFGDEGVRRPMKRRPELTPLDYRIISALSRDSRKPVAELAEELGVSAKTVKRRLDRMVQESVLEFSLEYDPAASPSAFVYFWVQLTPDADRARFISTFVKGYDRYILVVYPLTNIPGLLISILWAPTQKDVNDVETELMGDASVVYSRSNAIQALHFFDTWRERFVQEQARKIAPPA